MLKTCEKCNENKVNVACYNSFVECHACHTKKVFDRALLELEARMIKERDELMAILDKEEREAELMRLDIIENVFTLRCPRCKTAYLDFTGCAALTCGTCKAGFCAMCLKDCGSGPDTHSHVLRCLDKPTEGYFVKEDAFKEHHRKRMGNVINERLSKLSVKTRNFLLNKIQKELDDLGIKSQY